MVTQAIFEKCLAEIRAEMSKMRVQTDLKFQQVTEHAERHFTAAKERSRNLVQMVIQTIREEMQSNNAVLGAKFEKAHGGHVSNGGHSPPAHTISTFRIDPIPDKGSPSSDESEIVKVILNFIFQGLVVRGLMGTTQLSGCESVNLSYMHYRTQLTTI
jgi:hypothetical protein